MEIKNPKIEKFIPKRIYWIKSGTNAIQLSQNAISPNWSGGGKSSFLLVNYHQFIANYKKNKLSFDNMIEWKLNIQSTSGDSVHKFQVNDDQLHVKNLLGYQVYKTISYSALLDANTTLFNHYNENSMEKTASFLSPLNLSFSLGFTNSLHKTFKTDKYKKIDWTLSVSPISLNLVSVRDPKVNQVTYGIDSTKHSKIEFGPNITSALVYDFNRYSTWTSNLKYFTDYRYMTAELENKYTLNFNRYFSTMLYLNLQYNNNPGYVKNGKWGYLQRNETISFGLNYHW